MSGLEVNKILASIIFAVLIVTLTGHFGDLLIDIEHHDQKETAYKIDVDEIPAGDGDTVKKEDLALFKKAGINWLCLGIEAANRNVRLEISKGTFKDTKVDKIVELIQNSGISVLGNYIFGFPYDDKETMKQTLDLALKLKTEHANFYACTALPGSTLYYEAQKKGWYVPEYPNYEEFAFLSYDHHPLPTNTCSAEEVLEFRDEAWNIYFSDNEYHKVVKEKFGDKALNNLTSMAGIQIKRKILGH